MSDRPVWDRKPWAPLPQLVGEMTADVCVVGLGGSGLAAVEEAIEAGRSVIGIDAGPVAGEAAGRNGGFLLAGMAESYHDALSRWGAPARDMYQRTLDELDTLMSQRATRRVGSLRIAASSEELAHIESEISALTSDGFPAERYSGPEGEGALFPADGVCNPMERCRDLALSLKSRGAQLFEQSRANAIEPHLVRSEHGSVRAEHVIVAVDGRIEELFPELKGRVRTARLEMLATEPFEQRFDRPVYTAWGYMYWQQLENGSLAIGGMRDRFMEESWSIVPGPTPGPQEALDEYISGMGVTANVSHRWAGHAAYTPDRAPIFEQIHDSVWVVGGYCGHGNVMGSIYGRSAVQSALAGEPERLL